MARYAARSPRTPYALLDFVAAATLSGDPGAHNRRQGLLENRPGDRGNGGQEALARSARRGRVPRAFVDKAPEAELRSGRVPRGRYLGSRDQPNCPGMPGPGPSWHSPAVQGGAADRGL